MKKSFLLFSIALVSLLFLADRSAFGQATNQTVNPATVPVSRSSSHWQAHHEQLMQEAKNDRIDLLFLGDSITDFWRSPAPRFGTNLWAKYYAPLYAADFGISGDRTEHVIWRIDQGELDGLHPKVTVLMIGTNDIAAQIEAPAKINAIISKYADGDKIVYLNINDQFLDSDGKVPAAIMPDFLHPNEHGYQLWADAMNPTLFKMMGISK